MAYKLEIRPLATVEILEAFDWYELQREGLGSEFLGELEAFYTSLLRNPNSYGYYDKSVRQGKINRFPYITTSSDKPAVFRDLPEPSNAGFYDKIPYIAC